MVLSMKEWKRKFFLFYLLIGIEGLILIELLHIFILEIPLDTLVLYNLPFVTLQAFLTGGIYYFYTKFQLKRFFQGLSDGGVYKWKAIHNFKPSLPS